MSHLPAEALTYETVVAEYFLGLRGAGLMLSPLDLDLIRAWQRRGIPVPVVCRGLRRGLEDALRDRGPSVPAPRSLRAYRLAVEDEWTAYRRVRVGDAPAPPDESSAGGKRLEAARNLLASLRAGGAAHLRDAYGAAADALPAGAGRAGLDEIDEAIRKADDVLLRAWVGALPRPERNALGHRCAARAGARTPWTRRAEYRAILRAHLLEAAREAGLLCLRGSV